MAQGYEAKTGAHLFLNILTRTLEKNKNPNLKTYNLGLPIKSLTASNADGFYMEYKRPPAKGNASIRSCQERVL